MFAKNDDRAHASAAGGHDQPRQWNARTRVIVGILLGVLVIAGFIGVIVWVGANSDKLEEIESGAGLLLGVV